MVSAPFAGGPPVALDAEEAVIAALLLDDGAFARVSEIVVGRDFWDERARWIFTAAASIHDRREEITIPTVAYELDRNGRLDGIGGEVALFGIANRHFAATGVEAHARMVADASRRRDMIEVARRIVADAHLAGVDAEARVAGEVRRLDALVQAHAAPPPNGGPKPINWATFWGHEHRDEEWLLEPLLPRARAVSLYSPAKSGKSLLVLDVAARLATGQRVLDQRAGSAVDVLYLDFEMTEDDLYERLTDMGYRPDSDLTHLHYASLPSLPPLDTAAGGAALRELAASCNAALVIIDTTSRVISGPENDADTMRALHHHTGLPLKADGRTVLRLDHSGKALERGQRGTSAKNDDVDLVWELTAREGGLRLRATHRRQSWVPEFLDLVRLDDPLRHERAETTLPVGTMELVEQMNRLGIAPEWGGKRVRLALREAGVHARNDVVAAAIRVRKQQFAEETAEVSPNIGDTRFETNGDTSPGHPAAQIQGHLRDTRGHPSAGTEGVPPSQDGDTLPGPPAQAVAWVEVL
ncbi:MAG: AAA family ATPase [Dehalococcoidia bacterium]